MLESLTIIARFSRFVKSLYEFFIVGPPAVAKKVVFPKIVCYDKLKYDTVQGGIIAMQMNFRSAFNGFNREDVVHYIEFLNSKHSADLNQLNSELDYLRARKDETPATPEKDETIAQQAARIRDLFDRCTALEQELETLKAENEQLRAQIQSEHTQFAAQLDAARQQQHSYQSQMEAELEAYRRAERTERFARERAENLYRQANGALADATVKVDDAANQVSQMTDRVMAQLAELQDAVTGSKQALRDAAATMYSIRPGIDIP